MPTANCTHRAGTQEGSPLQWRAKPPPPGRPSTWVCSGHLFQVIFRIVFVTSILKGFSRFLVPSLVPFFIFVSSSLEHVFEQIFTRFFSGFRGRCNESSEFFFFFYFLRNEHTTQKTDSNKIRARVENLGVHRLNRAGVYPTGVRCKDLCQDVLQHGFLKEEFGGKLVDSSQDDADYVGRRWEEAP